MILRGSEQDGDGRVPTPALSGHVEDWSELAVDYLDGRAAPETKADIQNHLQECPPCAARLRIQQSIVTFVQETYLDDPPLDLEDRVLGEILFPSEPVTQPRKEEPQGWSVTWNKRIRPWLPATVVVVAVMSAMIAFGVVRSGSDGSNESADITQAVAISETSADGAAPPTKETTLADTSTTAAAATTTAVAEAPTETTVAMTGVGSAEEDVVETDPKAMASGLSASQAPAYLTFMASASNQPGSAGSSKVTTTGTTAAGETAGDDATEGVTPTQADEVADQIEALTGLGPLPEDLWLGGPTFAAYLPRDDAGQLVDLVRSIGTSVGLLVGLIVAPSAATSETRSRIVEQKRDLCELIANRTAKPSVANWAFTTSTLVPLSDRQDDWLPPDEAGTHVLVVIYVQQP